MLHGTHHHREYNILMPLDAKLYKFYGFLSRLTVSVSHVPASALFCHQATRQQHTRALLSAGGTNQSAHITSLDFLARCIYADVERREFV